MNDLLCTWVAVEICCLGPGPCGFRGLSVQRLSARLPDSKLMQAQVH